MKHSETLYVVERFIDYWRIIIDYDYQLMAYTSYETADAAIAENELDTNYPVRIVAYQQVSITEI